MIIRHEGEGKAALSLPAMAIGKWRAVLALLCRIDYHSYQLTQFTSWLEHLYSEQGRKVSEFLFGH